MTKIKILAIILIGVTAFTAFLLFQRLAPVMSPETVIKVDDVMLTVEVADTEQKQQRGLMFRESLPEDRGMLFIFEREGRCSFWMLNVRFPLDIIWFDASQRVVFIARNVQPCVAEPCPVYTPDGDAKYVLEVGSGLVDRYGIGLNSTFVFVSGP